MKLCMREAMVSILNDYGMMKCVLLPALTGYFRTIFPSFNNRSHQNNTTNFFCEAMKIACVVKKKLPVKPATVWAGLWLQPWTLYRRLNPPVVEFAHSIRFEEWLRILPPLFRSEFAYNMTSGPIYRRWTHDQILKYWKWHWTFFSKIL